MQRWPVQTDTVGTISPQHGIPHLPRICPEFVNAPLRSRSLSGKSDLCRGVEEVAALECGHSVNDR